MDQRITHSAQGAARPFLSGIMALLSCLVMAFPVRAASGDDLLEALQIDNMLGIMRNEGLTYGRDLAQDMLPGGPSEAWQRMLSVIYDIDKMRSAMHDSFAPVIAGTEPDPLMAFFTSDLGGRIVGLELAAREAMTDERVENAARQSFRDLEGSDDPRLDQIRRFVEVNDLLEANVTSALNASFKFYSGLVDGGGIDLSENDILSDVWAQEEETRKESREWLYAFLLLAYQPLEDAELETYLALSATAEGRVLNRALFAGFNAMYDDISYALGLAVAQQMQQQDL